MANIAVLIVAALAFQASLAFTPTRFLKNAELDETVNQIQVVAHDLSLTFQHEFNTVHAAKTLKRECEQLSVFLDNVINKLQVVPAHGAEQVVAELRDIQTTLHQATAYIEVAHAAQLKTLINTSIQNVAEQLVKLAHVDATTQGSFHYMVKTILDDFLTVIQDVHARFAYIVQQFELGPKELAMRVQEYTMRFNSVLRGADYYHHQEIKMALREFVHTLEMIVTKIQKEVAKKGDMEMHNLVHEITMKLNHLALTATRFIEGEENAKIELVEEFKVVADHFERVCQFFHVGTKLFQNIVNDYCFAIEKIFKHVQGEDFHQTFLAYPTTDFDSYHENAMYRKTPRVNPFYPTIEDFYRTPRFAHYKLGMSGDFEGKNFEQSGLKFQIKNAVEELGAHPQQLAMQIQAITNNMAMTVSFKHEDTKQNLRQWVKCVEEIVNRLESELMQSGAIQVVENLKNVLRTVYQYENVYTKHVELDVIFQKVATELKKLAAIAQFDQSHYNLTAVVKSVLVQYLHVLQRFQMEFHGNNQIVQVGKTPKELALQIQIVARRLIQALHVFAVPENKQTQQSLIWQARAFAHLMENIVQKLQIHLGENEQVIYKLNQIHLTLRRALDTIQVTGVEQLKYILATNVENACVEIQKLMWVAQEPRVNAPIKAIMLEFLAGLQNVHHQIQTELQLVVGKQNPKHLSVQIQSVAHRLFAFLQNKIHSAKPHFRQIVIVQVGELVQTVENVMQMLKTEVKTTGYNTQVHNHLIAKFEKISLTLQRMNEKEAKMTVEELCFQLAHHIQTIVVDMQKLSLIAESKLNEQVDSTHGTLHGVLNNVLATLRNMLIQFHAHEFETMYGRNAQELANQIQTITGKLTATLENVVPATKMTKQALAIYIFKYARHLELIAQKLETVQFDTLNLKQYVATLQQIAGAWTTKTVVELKERLVNHVQNINAEIQKVLLDQANVDTTTVKSVLVEYLAIVQNLYVRVHHVFLAGQKPETLLQLAVHIEYIVEELCMNLERATPAHQLFVKTIAVEAGEFSKILANIVDKLQSLNTPFVVVDKIAQHLKQIQFALQKVAEIEQTTTVEPHQHKMAFQAYVQRAAYVIKQLVWAVQPELYRDAKNVECEAVIRELVMDFLVAVQNVHLQIQNVYQNGQVLSKPTFGMKNVFDHEDYETMMDEGRYHQYDFKDYDRFANFDAPNTYKYFGNNDEFDNFNFEKSAYDSDLYKDHEKFIFDHVYAKKYENANHLVYRLQAVCEELAETLRVAPIETMKIRQFVQEIEQLMAKIETSQGYLPSVYYNLREVLEYLRQNAGAARFHYKLADQVQQIAHELQNQTSFAGKSVDF